MCGGVGAKAALEAAIGSDVSLATTLAIDSTEKDMLKFKSALTSDAEYTTAQVAAYEAAKTEAAGGLLFAGGVWVTPSCPPSAIFAREGRGDLICAVTPGFVGPNNRAALP